MSELHKLLEVITAPFVRSAASAEYRTPSSEMGDYRTFCGT